MSRVWRRRNLPQGWVSPLPRINPPARAHQLPPSLLLSNLHGSLNTAVVDQVRLNHRNRPAFYRTAEAGPSARSRPGARSLQTLAAMEEPGVQRVKVYRLNEEGLWDDRGTGHVSVEVMEVSRCWRAAVARGRAPGASWVTPCLAAACRLPPVVPPARALPASAAACCPNTRPAWPVPPCSKATAWGWW